MFCCLLRKSPGHADSWFTQRHCPSGRGTKDAVRVRKPHCQAPTGRGDSRHPHWKANAGLPCWYWWCIWGKAQGKLWWGQATINTSSGSPCSMGLYRALTESAFLRKQISNKQTNQEWHLLLHHWHFDPWDCKHHPIKLTQYVCFGCSRCSQSSLQTSLCLLVNQVLSYHSSAKCSWQHHHTDQVLRI